MCKEEMSIREIAKQLGLSPSTVSRALSGKGRVSQGTKEKIEGMLEKNNLQQRIRTNNICVLFHDYREMADIIMVSQIMAGIKEVTFYEKYDVVIAVAEDNHIDDLKRVVTNRKVDGVILFESSNNQTAIDFLRENKMPMVVLENGIKGNIPSVCNDYYGATMEMTGMMLQKPNAIPALFLENSFSYRNHEILRGFQDAFVRSGKTFKEENLFSDVRNQVGLEHAIRRALENYVNCMLCADDRICAGVVRAFHSMGKKMSEDIRLASLCNIKLNDDFLPTISTVDYDCKRLGNEAAKLLFQYINGAQTIEGITIPFRIMIEHTNY